MTNCKCFLIFSVMSLAVYGSAYAGTNDAYSSPSYSPMERPCPSAGALWAKFTVQKVLDDKTLEVTYPDTVFAATSEEDKEVDTLYIEKKGLKKKFRIYVNPGKTAPQAGHTYVYVRCPAPLFEMVREIAVDDAS